MNEIFPGASYEDDWLWLRFEWDLLTDNQEELLRCSLSWVVSWSISPWEYENYWLTEPQQNDDIFEWKDPWFRYYDFSNTPFYSNLRKVSKVLSRNDELKLTTKIKSLSDQLIWNNFLPGSNEFNKISSERDGSIDEFMSHNYRLAIKIANDYANYSQLSSSSLFDDLFQEWCIGLRKAIEDFDPGKWNSFYIYAKWWVKAMISNYLDCTSRDIRYSAWALENLKLLNFAIEEFKYSQGSQDVEPNFLEIMELTWLSRMAVFYLLDAPSTVLLSDIAFNNYYPRGQELFDGTFWDCAPDNTVSSIEDDLIIKWQIEELFSKSKLKKRDLEIIRRRFWFSPHNYEQNQQEIWRVLNVSRQRINFIEARAIWKLKEVFEKYDI